MIASDEGRGNAALFEIGILWLLAFRLVSEGLDLYLGSSVSSLISLVLIAIQLLYVALYGRLPKAYGGAIYLFFIFVGSAAVTFAINSGFLPATQLAQISKFLLYITTFIFFVSAGLARKRLLLLVSILMGTVGIELLFSVHQVMTGTGYIESVSSAYVRGLGLTSHPVLFGIKLFIASVIIAALARAGVAKWSLWVFIAATALAQYLSFSRTGWFMYGIWLAFIVVFSKSLPVRAIAVLLAAGGLVAAVATGRLDDLVTLPAFIEAGGYRYFSPLMIESSVHWRLVQWYQMVALASGSEWFGQGAGIAESLSRWELSSHNSFIDIYVEQGLFGLITLTTFLTALFLAGRRGLLRLIADGRRSRWHLLLFHTAFAAYIAAMLFSVSLFNQTLNMTLFFMLLGILMNPRLELNAPQAGRPEQRNRLFP